MSKLKLMKGDEQFDAFRRLAKAVGCPCPEEAAYGLEVFSTEYYMNDETPAMSLSLAKKAFSEMSVENTLANNGG